MATTLEKVKVPMVVVVRSLPPLFRNTSVPESPATAAAIVIPQVTVTLVTTPVTIPAPKATEQVWPAGCANTVTT